MDDKNKAIEDELFSIHENMSAIANILRSLNQVIGHGPLTQLGQRIYNVDKCLANIGEHVSKRRQEENDKIGEMLRDLNLENEMRNKGIIETND